MDPDPYQRARLAYLLTAKANDYEFKQDAYGAAGVNSGTWARLEAGLTVKSYILKRVVKNFWPEAGGDWRKVLAANPPTQEESLAIAAESLSLPIVDKETGT